MAGRAPFLFSLASSRGRVGGSLTGVVAAMLVWVLYRQGSRLDRFATRIF
jgi:hypothetical protein